MSSELAIFGLMAGSLVVTGAMVWLLGGGPQR
jgi:hypothetical protein